MRRLLKARELGLPEGDTSTLETSESRHDPSTAARSTATRVDAARLHLLCEMLRIRRFEEKCAELYSLGKIRGFLHLYIGEEAVAVGAMQALTARRRHRSTYREHGHALARGIPAGAVMAEMYGKANGCSRGRGGSMHLFDVRPAVLRRATRSSAAGCRWPSGWPWPTSCRIAARVTACFFGDGAVAEGEFHESLNLAALWKLPVLFLCENNLYAMGTALEAASVADGHPSKAAGYGIPAEAVDGMDVLAVEAATRQAVDAVRRGAARTCWKPARIAFGRTRCTTPSCIAPKTKSSSGRHATRSRLSRPTAARAGTV